MLLLISSNNQINEKISAAEKNSFD